MENAKNVKIVKDVYIYENSFKNENGDLVNYAKLACDVQIGSTICRLTKSLKGFEVEYVKNLIAKDSANDFLAN